MDVKPRTSHFFLWRFTALVSEPSRFARFEEAERGASLKASRSTLNVERTSHFFLWRFTALVSEPSRFARFEEAERGASLKASRSTLNVERLSARTVYWRQSDVTPTDPRFDDPHRC